MEQRIGERSRHRQLPREGEAERASGAVTLFMVECVLYVLAEILQWVDELRGADWLQGGVELAQRGVTSWIGTQTHLLATLRSGVALEGQAAVARLFLITTTVVGASRFHVTRSHVQQRAVVSCGRRVAGRASRAGSRGHVRRRTTATKVAPIGPPPPSGSGGKLCCRPPGHHRAAATAPQSTFCAGGGR
jgi:hypothetical protein